MTSKAKAKGSSWEREICNKLGEIFGLSFTRSMNSGAFIGGTNSVRKGFLAKGQISAMKGDIIPPDEMPFLNIEAKNYKDIAFHQIIDGCCKQLDGWINQTEEPADEGDISFTIFKITRKGSWVAFEAGLRDQFVIGSHVYYIKDGKTPYIVTTFEEFFRTNKDAIFALVKEKV